MRKVLSAVGILAVLVMVGCASLSSTADPVVVRAEQTLSVGTDALDAFLYLEHTNSAQFVKVWPQAHAVAESIRLHAPGKIHAVESAIESYLSAKKLAVDVKTLGNESSAIQACLADLAVLVAQANQALAAWKGSV